MTPPPGEDRRPPMTPQLALRVAVVGSFALAMFAIIFFRLWFLQVLSGDQYLAQARGNRTREIAIAPARGEVLDRSGTVLVSSTKALVVQISPPDLPKGARAQAVLFRRLAHVLGISTRRHRCRYPVGHSVVVRHLAQIPCQVRQQLALLPYADVNVKQVNRFVQYYLAERQSQFQGVQVTTISVPGYPQKTLAAQLLGTVGRITPQQVRMKAYRGVSANSIIGQSGLEGWYDRYLRGTQGSENVQVDALGRATGVNSKTNPIAGHNLALSIDAKLQRVGQQALATSIASNPGATAGAFVAMNPDNGQVYALGSMPTFDPTVFTRTLSESTYRSLTSPTGGDPLLNRAIQSAGPTGSTFKPITATAALQSGDWTTGDVFDDTGQFCISGQCRHNAGNAVDGSLDLVNAIRVSSDDFFYNLGVKTNVDPYQHPSGGPLDQWARRFGIGRPTGIDLPGEDTGTLPTPRWRQERNKLEAECDHATGPFKGKPKHPSGGCGIADGTNRPWSVGDNENLAVGQGDVQATPLQLAVAYSALANGGTIVRPHIGLDVQNPDGTVLQKIDPAPARHLPVNPFYLDTIRQGLRAAASQSGGTSADVMGSFPEQV
jgi:penicillin-binding protein 2